MSEYDRYTNKYTSSNAVIIAGPGTMYNEITRQKPVKNIVNENTNTYAITTKSLKRRTKK